MTLALDKVQVPRLEVTVTEDDIRTAIPANSERCMIAEALTNCFQKKYGQKPFAVSIDLQSIRLTDRRQKTRFVFLTPPVAQRALLQFDLGIRPTPFHFWLTKKQIMQGKPPPLAPLSRRKFGIRQWTGLLEEAANYPPDRTPQ